MATKSNIISKNKIILRPLLFTLGILLIPFLGNLSVQGWMWGSEDFITMGVLIFVTGLLVELANKKIKNKNYRLMAIGGIILALLVLWVELATDGVSRSLGLLLQ